MDDAARVLIAFTHTRRSRVGPKKPMKLPFWQLLGTFSDESRRPVRTMVEPRPSFIHEATRQ
jgi:hypothetical protein